MGEPRRFDQAFEPEEMVYLTAESDTTLEAIDPTKVYIIGGIVDRNRHKGMCHQLAADAKIATARLPIQAPSTTRGRRADRQEHMKMSTRVVITVDQGAPGRRLSRSSGQCF